MKKTERKLLMLLKNWVFKTTSTNDMKNLSQNHETP